MRKLFLFLVCLGLSFNCFAVDSWEKGTGEAVPLGTESPADLDTLINQYVSDPLEFLLHNYRYGCRLEYASASTITIGAGDIVVSNAGGTIRAFTSNSAAITAAWTDIDTGSEAVGTTYYVYIECADPTADEPAFTAVISTNATTPTGITYYARLGSFYNNASSNITDIQNDGFFGDFGAWETRTDGVTYQATTDGFVVAGWQGSGDAVDVAGYTDSSTPPTTIRAKIDQYYPGGSGVDCSFTMPVKTGDYWKVTGCDTIYWIPMGV